VLQFKEKKKKKIKKDHESICAFEHSWSGQGESKTHFILTGAECKTHPFKWPVKGLRPINRLVFTRGDLHGKTRGVLMARVRRERETYGDQVGERNNNYVLPGCLGARQSPLKGRKISGRKTDLGDGPRGKGKKKREHINSRK